MVHASSERGTVCRVVMLPARLLDTTLLMTMTSLLVMLLLLVPSSAVAQVGYYNLDAGRPTRVEDAVPTERHALDLQLPTTRLERLDAGALRWRGEPKLSLGALPLTELEVRVPLAFTRARGGATTFGMAGIGVGALHALDIEAGRMPAFAVGAEVLLPVGNAAGSMTTYSLRALATRTTVAGRVHLNAIVGTYALPPARGTRATGPRCPDGSIPTPAGVCSQFPQIPDPPCDRIDGGESAHDVEAKVEAHAERPAIARPATTTRGELVLDLPGAPPNSEGGSRWMVGLAGDHAFALQSTLLTADVFVEQFRGAYRATEWTAEGGARHQWTPRLVLDAGMARRFTGPAPATSLTLGLTYAFAFPLAWR